MATMENLPPMAETLREEPTDKVPTALEVAVVQAEAETAVAPTAVLAVLLVVLLMTLTGETLNRHQIDPMTFSQDYLL